MNLFEKENGEMITLCDDCEEQAEVDGMVLRWIGRVPNDVCYHCHKSL